MIITLPNIDPVALALGPISIRWYSLAYILGILFTMFWIKRCNRNNQLMSTKAYDDWLFWAVLSIMLGGRLGYVLFYNPPYFLQNPLEILAIWQGGMSFHGGLCGAIIGMYLFAKKNKIEFLRLTDVLSIAAPVGLFCGRIANFINMELYGRVTDGNYGVIFPNAGALPRHPSQLYEAGLEGVLAFIILISLYKFTNLKEKFGILSGIFLTLYGSFRILIENFRQPDEQIGFILGKMTMGQALSMPLILLGITLILRGLFQKK
jgi:phosphatidylglycerol:prolipoprotein diacylglycerol transferase